MGKLKDDDYQPWKDETVLDIVGDNIWHDSKATPSETQLTLQELSNWILLACDELQKKSWHAVLRVNSNNSCDVDEEKSEQVLQETTKYLLALFQQALTSVKNEMEELACDKCRVRMEDKLNNGGTQHDAP